MDKVTFCNCKMLLSFVAVTSFYFFSYCVFVRCGVGQSSEASAVFGGGWLVLFLLAVFNFIPQVVVFLFFSRSLPVTGWRFTFSVNSF